VAGPASAPGGRGRRPNPTLFIVGTALILLVGAGALLRSRRASDRVT
jgi:hypothetical protein